MIIPVQYPQQREDENKKKTLQEGVTDFLSTNQNNISKLHIPPQTSAPAPNYTAPTCLFPEPELPQLQPELKRERTVKKRSENTTQPLKRHSH
jgi:hypothetical protein